MEANKNTFLDANAVLRYVLQDIEEQYKIVKDTVKTEYCVVTLEVMSEVAFVLDGVYQVPRTEAVRTLRRLSRDVIVQNADVYLRALEIYDKTPKLDFVDCLMFGYKLSRGVDVLTFDKKLKSRLDKGI